MQDFGEVLKASGAFKRLPNHWYGTVFVPNNEAWVGVEVQGSSTRRRQLLTAGKDGRALDVYFIDRVLDLGELNAAPSDEDNGVLPSRGTCGVLQVGH